MSEKDLSPEAITSNLETCFIGQKVIYYPSVPSTMEVARREAHWGAPAGTVIVAEGQTSGHGRQSRAWLSPAGSLAISVILRPNIVYLPRLIMLASLAAARTIEQVTGLKAGIKWPNDILIGTKKVCGILIENEVRKNTLVHAVIGIGINVNMHMVDLPDILEIATSLSDECGGEVSKLKIVRQLLVEMDKLYKDMSTGETLFEKWRDTLITLGKTVRVVSSDDVIEGTAESVDKDGVLLVRQKDGRLTRVVAGDAHIIR